MRERKKQQSTKENNHSPKKIEPTDNLNTPTTSKCESCRLQNRKSNFHKKKTKKNLELFLVSIVFYLLLSLSLFLEGKGIGLGTRSVPVWLPDTRNKWRNEFWPGCDVVYAPFTHALILSLEVARLQYWWSLVGVPYQQCYWWTKKTFQMECADNKNTISFVFL